jgi:antitoxin FitA
VKTLAISISDEVAAKLEHAARQRGISVEDLLLRSAEREADFESAAEYVLAKNAELYERLA